MKKKLTAQQVASLAYQAIDTIGRDAWKRCWYDGEHLHVPDDLEPVVAAMNPNAPAKLPDTIVTERASAAVSRLFMRHAMAHDIGAIRNAVTAAIDGGNTTVEAIIAAAERGLKV